MSFKDDFIEALRSVKRDFFHEHEYTEQDTRAAEPQAAASGEKAESSVQSGGRPEHPIGVDPVALEEPSSAADADSDVFRSFRQASTVPESAANIPDSDDDYTPPSGTDHYRRFDAGASAPESQDLDRRAASQDYESVGIYDDDKTIISKNTVIRGAVQTEDSIRLLGQVMGDIDCKSNIVVAGKVRGNTTAANAYLFEAQIDGDVRCEDVISISNDAWVLGNIRAQQAEIDGKIKGNIEIRHTVSIGASSSILGDISTDELEIKRGAFINGQIMMYSPSRDVIDRFDSFDK